MIIGRSQADQRNAEEEQQVGAGVRRLEKKTFFVSAHNGTFNVVNATADAGAGLLLAEQLRRQRPGLRVLANCGGGGFKAQFKRADRSGAALALVLGDAELGAGTVGVKWLREARDQQVVTRDALPTLLAEVLGQADGTTQRQR